MKDFIRKNAIVVSLSFVSVLMIVCCCLIFINKNKIDQAVEMMNLAENTKIELISRHFEIVTNLDVAIRGYALIRKERFLWVKPNELKAKMELTFNRLDSLLKVQGYSDSEGWQDVKAYQDYIRMLVGDFETMSIHLQNHQDSAFFQIFSQNKGDLIGKTLLKAHTKIIAFEDGVINMAQENYSSSFRLSMIVGVIMVMMGILSFTIVLIKLKRDERNRKILLKKLDENNKNFLFNSGQESLEKSEEMLINNSIENFQKASNFVTKISEGNLNVNWEGLNESNISLNKNSLAGLLLQLRENFKKIKIEDEKRNWLNEGLTKFSVLVRNAQQNGIEELSNEIVKFLTKYLNAQQGSFFVLNNEHDRPYLELKACYAFDRKKIIKKRIEIGEGLIGQAYLESDRILLKQIPPKYTSITSGLGDASPNCLLIIPFKHNEKVEAIFEIASFRIWQNHEIEFLEKAGDFVASSITAVKTSAKMKELLIESQLQAEQLMAAEEEMRQNIEEMESTQEQMKRRELENEILILEKLKINSPI